MSSPRAAALELLRVVREDDAYANLAMPAVIRSFKLSERDAALATELAYGTLRGQRLYDAVIDACVSRSIEPSMRDLLRLGAHQLLGMRVPAHAAVSETVDLARLDTGPKSDPRTKARAGFANAVLRRIGEMDREAWIERLGAADDSITSLAVRHSHPDWIARAFAMALGARSAELAALLEADNLPAAVSLAARPGRCTREELLALPGVEPGRWSPWAGTLQGAERGLLKGIVEGNRIRVQDEGSQLAVLALLRAGGPPAPGERWLDMCAGPGGKAALLADLLPAGGTLVAIEPHEHRARLVLDAVDDPEIEVVVGDARTAPWGERRFDRILLDAPCTGLGSLRRRPEARWRKQPSDAGELAQLQRELLGAGVAALSPGGVIAYVTCTPHPAETESVVDACARGHGIRRLDVPALIPEIPDCASTNGVDLQLWPHRHGTDAMFVAVLQRA